MKSADERHVTHTDRERGTYIPEGKWTRRGISSASRGSIEQTMPRQTFEEAVLPHLDPAFNYARRGTGRRRRFS
jgi:hypothetical protein